MVTRVAGFLLSTTLIDQDAWVLLAVCSPTPTVCEPASAPVNVYAVGRVASGSVLLKDTLPA
jgi:hypothetical protein